MNLMGLLAQTTNTLRGETPWLPPQASTVATEVDWLMNVIWWITVFFTVLILGLMVFFVLKYRHKPGRKVEPSAGHSTTLELTWTIIPTILVVAIFFWGFRGYLNMIVTPPNTYEITAKGFMWGWAFTYPNGFISKDLHVPANTPVRLVLTSDDVIHALYIPAMRLQKMNTPGRYNRMWFEAKFVGDPLTPTADGSPYTEEHMIYCNMYCGTKHSEMLAKLVVHRPEDFPKWLAEASDVAGLIAEGRLTPVQHGEALYTARGCVQCHSEDGRTGIGPTWKDLFGSVRNFTNGTSAEADENYLRESILNPGNRVTVGYNNVMPSYRGQLKDVDIDALIAYMKTLSANWTGGDPNIGFRLPAGTRLPDGTQAGEGGVILDAEGKPVPAPAAP